MKQPRKEKSETTRTRLATRIRPKHWMTTRMKTQLSPMPHRPHPERRAPRPPQLLPRAAACLSARPERPPPPPWLLFRGCRGCPGACGKEWSETKLGAAAILLDVVAFTDCTHVAIVALAAEVDDG